VINPEGVTDIIVDSVAFTHFSKHSLETQKESTGVMTRFFHVSVLVAWLAALCLMPRVTQADALMVSEAAKASSIVEYFVDEQGVRVELELGLNSLDAFRNLMPQAIYERMGHGDTPIEARLRTFFERDLAILVDGMPLAGYVTEIGPTKRVLRDPINGTPLPVQADTPDVVSASLFYPFAEGVPPSRLVLIAPGGIDIGFVLYHKGVAVNDYRYLGSGYELIIDWEDPWYSRFKSNQLRRQYSAPMSGFIYVENFEVRKEIIVRPKDLQRWIDLGLEGRDDIPVELQADIKLKVGEFLSQHHPVAIDGEPVTGLLESVHFLERTLTSSRVIDPPELLDLDVAVMGAIFVYPRNGLPKSVTMDWDLWDERIQRIPVSSVDQAGPLPSFLDPEWTVLEWNNYLKNPVIPTLADVELPVQGWRKLLDVLWPILLVLAASALVWLVARARAGQAVAPAIMVIGLLSAGGLAASQLGANNQPDQERAAAIVGDLLHNVYRAFDYREEGDIYDVLALSVSGELLTDIYLETKRGLELANQGGAKAKVKEVVLDTVETLPVDADNAFEVEASWTVHGSVGHWGHVHQRSNRYLARLRVAVDEDRWKLESMVVLQEERL
jgi:hypothetical protein